MSNAGYGPDFSGNSGPSVTPDSQSVTVKLAIDNSNPIRIAGKMQPKIAKPGSISPNAVALKATWINYGSPFHRAASSS